MIVGVLAAVALVGVALAVRLLRADPERVLAGFVERAVARLPGALQTRYAEEWRADLAALSGRPLAALVWALGLRRASIRLGRPAWRPSFSTVAQAILDAGALAFAFYAGFSLRFEAGVPEAYAQLFRSTLPAAVVGGLLSLVVTGVYGPRTSMARVVGGVGLATLVVIAYVALAQPVLISSARGLTGLTVPAGVSVVFALTAGLLLLVSRVGTAIVMRTGPDRNRP